MIKPLHITLNLLRVLSVLDPDHELAGVDIAERTGLPNGCFFPILKKLLERGIVRRLPGPRVARTGPARVLYQLTDEGRSFAGTVFDAAPQWRRS